MRILVVDDDADFTEALKDALEREGYEVRAARNGGQGLEALTRGPQPDAILLDVLMPEVGGSEFLWRLRERPELAGVPVIVMSSLPREMVTETGPPVLAVLRKPFPVEAIRAILAPREERTRP